MRSDLPHPRATPNDWRAVGGATGKMKKEVHPLYFFIFDSVKKRREPNQVAKCGAFSPEKTCFFGFGERSLLHKKRFQRERFIPLDAQKCHEHKENVMI